MQIIAFDIDGVLLNSISTYVITTKLTLNQHGIKEIPEEEYQNFSMCSYITWIDDTLKYVSDNYGANIPNKNEFQSAHLNNIMKSDPSNYKLFDGLEEVAKTFIENGYKTCIISNMLDEHFNRIVKPLLSNIEFDFLCLKEDNIQKPNPKFLDKVLEYFQCNSSDITYIGDLYEDYEFAKSTGMNFIFATWGYDNNRLINVEGVTRANSPKDLLNLV